MRSRKREGFGWPEAGLASKSRSRKGLTLNFYNGTIFFIDRRQLKEVLEGKIRAATILEPPAQRWHRQRSAKMRRVKEGEERRADARKENRSPHTDTDVVLVLNGKVREIFDGVRREQIRKRKLLKEW